jgi:hypothetical protein
MKKLFLFLIIGMFLINFVSAYEPHGQDQDLQFSITSNFATECELTTINTPKGLVFINQEGTRIDQTFNYTILGGNYSQLGTYTHNIVCTDGEEIVTGEVIREVTGSGSQQSTSQSLLSSGILFSLVFLAFFFGILSWKFLDKEKTFPFGLFFLLISFVFVVYTLYMGVLFSQDFLSEATLNVQSIVFIGIALGLIGIAFLGLTFLIIQVLGEIKERKSLIKYGGGFDSKTKTYR